MANEQQGIDITVPASADLSANQYLAHEVNSSGQLALNSAITDAVGILQNKPSAAGRGGTLRIAGVSKFTAGTSGVTAGDKLSPEAGTGKLITASATDVPCGIALVTVAANAIGQCILTFNPGATL